MSLESAALSLQLAAEELRELAKILKETAYQRRAWDLYEEMGGIAKVLPTISLKRIVSVFLGFHKILLKLTKELEKFLEGKAEYAGAQKPLNNAIAAWNNCIKIIVSQLEEELRRPQAERMVAEIVRFREELRKLMLS